MNPSSYPIMEFFPTLQGEGAYTGHAAFFIRLEGCDVGCHWCDVKESWEISPDHLFSPDQLLKEAIKYSSRMVVITGGEPTMHDLGSLTAAFQQSEFRTHLETSGTHPITGVWDWITLSPKKFKPCLPANFAIAHELKVVVFHPSDLQWAEELAQFVKKDCKLYLQPEWGKAEKLTPLIIEYIQSNPKWQLSLQTHKFLNIP